MITRQDVFHYLFSLKSKGVNVEVPLNQMAKTSGVPKEVINFLVEKEVPKFQFYRYLQKYQKALVKNILNYDSLTMIERVKICSSLITRAMIAVEYKNIDGDLLDQLSLDEISESLRLAFSVRQDFSEINKVLESHRVSIKLFLSQEDQNGRKD